MLQQYPSHNRLCWVDMEIKCYLYFSFCCQKYSSRYGLYLSLMFDIYIHKKLSYDSNFHLVFFLLHFVSKEVFIITKFPLTSK